MTIRYNHTMDLITALRRHETSLQALTADQAAKLYASVVEYKRAILEGIGPLGRMTAADAVRTLSALDPLLEALRFRVELQMVEGMRLTHALALNHHAQVMALQGLDIDLTPVRARVLASLADQTLIARYSAGVYMKGTHDAVRAGLMQAVMQGQTKAETARTVARMANVSQSKGTLISRMELARAYSVAASKAAEESPGDWTRMIVETIDHNNHPFSREANGTRARPGERFKVSVAGVARHARAMKRKVGTVLWPQSDGFYRGTHLPAHYNERGRIVPWRTDWDNPVE